MSAHGHNTSLGGAVKFTTERTLLPTVQMVTAVGGDPRGNVDCFAIHPDLRLIEVTWVGRPSWQSSDPVPGK